MNNNFNPACFYYFFNNSQTLDYFSSPQNFVIPTKDFIPEKTTILQRQISILKEKRFKDKLLQSIDNGSYNDVFSLVYCTDSREDLVEIIDLAISRAARFGQKKILQFLIDYRKDNLQYENYNNVNLYDPLHQAICTQQIQLIKYLLKNKYCSVNGSLDNDFRKKYPQLIPINQAVIVGNEKIVLYLIKKSARVNGFSNGSSTPIYYATIKGHNKILQILLEKGAAPDCLSTGKDTALYQASLRGNTEAVCALLEYNADSNSFNKGTQTPIFQAAINEFTDIIKVLLYCNADPNANSKGKYTPLYAAVNANKVKSVKMLLARALSKTADVNAFAQGQETPIYCAAEKGYYDIVNVLLTKKANVNACATGENTPLFIANKNNHIEIVNLLKEYGATQ